MPERVSPQQREEEPFRWCVHCDADCQDDDAPHAEWCPQRTGVYPVEERWHCPHCLRGFDQARFDPYCCSECRTPFSRGDHYVLRPIETDVFDPVCLTCGVAASERTP